MIPVNHNKDQHGTITLRVHQWHTYVGSNKQLSDWTSDPFDKRKIMLSTGNVTNYPKLVTSWLLRRTYGHHFTKLE